MTKNIFLTGGCLFFLMACTLPSVSPVLKEEQTLDEMKSAIRSLPINVEKQEIKNSSYTKELALYIKKVIQSNSEPYKFSNQILRALSAIFHKPDNVHSSDEEFIAQSLKKNNVAVTPEGLTLIFDYLQYIRSQESTAWRLIWQEVLSILDEPFYMEQIAGRNFDSAGNLYISPILEMGPPVDPSLMDFSTLAPIRCLINSYSINEPGYQQKLLAENDYSSVINADFYITSILLSCDQDSNNISGMMFYTSFFQEGKKVTFYQDGYSFTEYYESNVSNYEFSMNLCFNAQQQNIDYIEHFAVVRLDDQGEFITPTLKLVIDRELPCPKTK